MSKEAAEEFRNKVNSAPELQDKLRAAVQSDDPFAAAVAIGAEQGLSFTSEEIQEAMTAAAEGELSDFELEAVAGGKGRRRRSSSRSSGEPPPRSSTPGCLAL